TFLSAGLRVWADRNVCPTLLILAATKSKTIFQYFFRQRSRAATYGQVRIAHRAGPIAAEHNFLLVALSPFSCIAGHIVNSLGRAALRILAAHDGTFLCVSVHTRGALSSVDFAVSIS